MLYFHVILEGCTALFHGVTVGHAVEIKELLCALQFTGLRDLLLWLYLNEQSGCQSLG